MNRKFLLLDVFMPMECPVAPEHPCRGLTPGGSASF